MQGVFVKKGCEYWVVEIAGWCCDYYWMAGLSNAATPRQCSFTHFFHPLVTKCIVSALALCQCMAMAGQYDGCDAELSIAAAAGPGQPPGSAHHHHQQHSWSGPSPARGAAVEQKCGKGGTLRQSWIRLKDTTSSSDFLPYCKTCPVNKVQIAEEALQVFVHV